MQWFVFTKYSSMLLGVNNCFRQGVLMKLSCLIRFLFLPPRTDIFGILVFFLPVHSDPLRNAYLMIS